MLRVCLIHSFYRSAAPSGENETVLAEMAALERAGLDVRLVSVQTEDEPTSGEMLRAAARVATGYGRSPMREVLAHNPDIIHVHNLFPGWSDRWVKTWHGPLVATVHNFRFVCANGVLERGGQKCLKCLHGSRGNALKHGCYHGSRLQTLPVVTRMLRTDSLLREADRVVAPSQPLASTLRRRLGDEGSRVVVQSPFLPESLRAGGVEPSGPGSAWCYVGRVSPEKGLVQLLRDWPQHEDLTVIGDGVDLVRAKAVASSRSLSVKFLGNQTRRTVMKTISCSYGVIFPSLVPETFGMVYLEAISLGKPVIARQGTVISTLVKQDGTGVEYRGVDALAHALCQVRPWGVDRASEIRGRFEQNYTEKTFIQQRLNLYEEIIK